MRVKSCEDFAKIFAKIFVDNARSCGILVGVVNKGLEVEAVRVR